MESEQKSETTSPAQPAAGAWPKLVWVLTTPSRWLKSLYLWVIGWADRPGGTIALGAISFAESSFFPIPPDPLMWALCIGNRRRSFFYATVNTVASVLGGIFGWILGMYLFSEVVDWVIQLLGIQASWYGEGGTWEHYLPDSYLYKAQELFNQYGFWALFVAALTPIPYKVATIASGFFGLALPTMIFGSILGRGMRFYAFGALFFFFGDWAKKFIEKYFGWISLALAAMLIGGFYAMNVLLK